MAEFEPFDSKKHKAIQLMGQEFATEQTVTPKYKNPFTGKDEYMVVPSIWFDTKTKQPKQFDEEKSLRMAREYEQKTKKRFPRFNSEEEANKFTKKRTDKDGATKKPLSKNKGGTVMKEQMEKAFMQDGGLQDEGGTIDKESGNEVPSGSLKKEVRDDIPAMLSEGEFVFPADVVRFIGLNKLMQMRQEAKMGLKLMEKMGQMGNSEEAEIPDDLPFGVTDIIVMEDKDSKNEKEKEKEMSEGGVLTASNGMDTTQLRRRMPTPFEQAMGYAPGEGINPYQQVRVPYTDKDGKIVNILEDNLGRPMEDTTGFTRVTPYKAGPVTGADSVPPISDLPDNVTEKSIPSEGMSDVFYKGRRLTNAEVDKITSSDNKFFTRRLSDPKLDLQTVLDRAADSNTGRMLVESTLDPEAYAYEQERLKKKRRKKERRDTQQKAIRENYSETILGDKTFPQRLKMATKDIKARGKNLGKEIKGLGQSIKTKRGRSPGDPRPR